MSIYNNVNSVWQTNVIHEFDAKLLTFAHYGFILIMSISPQ